MRKAIIVGAGISACTAAQILKKQGFQIEIFESRPHIGGNCYTKDEYGITFHKYGPHLFHTNDKNVWDFLSDFTSWSDYRHKVIACTHRGNFPIPFNKVSESIVGELSDSEIINLVFRDYSAKQWGVPWEELPDSIKNRVPKRRDNDNCDYFTDKYQGQPKHGFTEMFNGMLEGVMIHTGVEKNAWKKSAKTAEFVVYTGKIDEYFDYCYGRLPYRSLDFNHSWNKPSDSAVFNKCTSDFSYTRVYDHSFWSPGYDKKCRPHSLVTYETPCAHTVENEPYYPMPFGEGAEVYKKYRALADNEKDVVFVGRLATYKYLDMWMAVRQTMNALL